MPGSSSSKGLKKAVSTLQQATSASSKKKTESLGGAPSKAPKQPQAKPNGLPRLIAVPDRASPDDPLKLHFYAAEGKAQGLVVFAPGSRGGMGPGQAMSTIGMFNPRVSSIYPEVAQGLAKLGFASAHLTWRLNPTRKGAPPGTLKSPTQLMLGVADIALAARYLRAQHGKRGVTLPLSLVGFSFGGPSTMAAGALAVAPGSGEAAKAADTSGMAPLCGVITLGCGMRVDHGGSKAFKDIGNRLVGGASRARPHDYGGVDSESCVDAYAAVGLPLCMIHGLADVTVDPRASATIFSRARGPKAALWLEGADHQARTRFDVVCSTLLEWIPALLQRPAIAPSAAAGSATEALITALTQSQPLPPAAGATQHTDVAAGGGDGEQADTEQDEEGGEDDQLGQADEALALDGTQNAGPGDDEGEEEEEGSSGAPSDVDEPDSAPSTFRDGDADATALPIMAMGGLTIGSDAQSTLINAPPLPPDEHCPFLNGEARTL
jgi:fermentation-respiration switch protein FrsA (DUF1100 family)